MNIPSPSSQSTSKIAVVGAGLAGLATALFLHRLNLGITIFEARPRDTSDGGFLALAPNAAHVLEQLGLYQDLLTKGFAYEDYTFLSARNCSKIGVVLNGSIERYGYPALRISRHILRQTLINAVTSAGIGIHYGHKVTSLDEAATDVSITFASGETLTFDYLIAGDGIHSRVRHILFPSAPEPTFTGQMGIGGGKIPAISISSNIPQPSIFIGAKNSFMMMPTSPDGSEVGISATIETGERTRQQWADLVSDSSQIKRMLLDLHCTTGSSWPEVVRHACEITNAESLSVWPFYTAPVLESWTSRAARVVLIGDAAHAMPPTGGQGAAMAFEDAASIALVFSELNGAKAGKVAAEGQNAKVDITSGLLAWQMRRQERIKQVKNFTTRGGDMRRATSGLVQQLIKEWSIWVFFLIKGREGGFAWIYDHREKGPRVTSLESKAK